MPTATPWTREDHVRVPPDHPQYTLRRVWLTPEEERGILLRVRQRRYLAALPHRAHAPGLPRGGLGALSRRQPQVRRCAARGDRDTRPTPWCWCRITISRCCRAMIKRAAARRAGGDLLAHSLAQSGGLRHLPVAARTARRPAGRRPDRVSHPGALQQLSGHRGPQRWNRGSTGSASRSTAAAT